MKSAEAFLAELAESDPSLLNSQSSESDFGLEDFPVTDVVKSLQQTMESRAVALLATREHGDKELLQKLKQKFSAEYVRLTEQAGIPGGNFSQICENVLQKCQENNWQNDERYIEVAVTSLSQKGQGPLKISQKLKQTTSKTHLIRDYLDFGREGWAEIAREVLQKKYGETKPDSLQTRAKWTRFLQSRGFEFDHINRAMR